MPDIIWNGTPAFFNSKYPTLHMGDPEDPESVVLIEFGWLDPGECPVARISQGADAMIYITRDTLLQAAYHGWAGEDFNDNPIPSATD